MKQGVRDLVGVVCLVVAALIYVSVFGGGTSLLKPAVTVVAGVYKSEDGGLSPKQKSSL